MTTLHTVCAKIYDLLFHPYRIVVKDADTHHRKVIRYWSRQMYVPRWMWGDMRIGLTPEAHKRLMSLPENQLCEDCQRTLWVCTCMVEIDNNTSQ